MEGLLIGLSGLFGGDSDDDWDIQPTLPLGRWSILQYDAKAGDKVQLLVARVRRNDE